MTDPNDRYRPPAPDDQTRYVPPAAPVPGGQEQQPRHGESHQPGYGQSPQPVGSAPTQPGYGQAPYDADWATPAPTTPPVSPAPRRRSGGPLRWIVALLATLIVVGAIAGVAYFASSTSTPASASLAYMPPETVSYTEIRMDLPGTQREKVSRFLAHFPGFQDRTTLDQGLDQALDRLLKQVSKERYSYTGDIKPWFTGQLSYAMLDAPAMVPSITGGATPSTIGRVLVVLGVQDRAKAQTELDKIRGDLTGAGGSVVTSDANGTQIVTLSGKTGDQSGSYALTNDAIVMATRVEDLTAALSRKTSNGASLAGAAGFKDNLGKLGADRVGLSYFNTDGLRGQLQALAPAGRPGSAIVAFLASKVPSVVMSSIRFEGDRLVADGYSKSAAGATVGSGRDSGLAKRVPADSLAYAEIADLGTFVRELVTAVKADPFAAQAGPDAQQQITQVEGILGAKLENYFDWLGNLSIAGGLSNGKPAVALVASVTDEALARTRITQLTSLISAAGGSTGIKVRQQDYAGTSITLLDLGSLSSAVPGMGADQSLGFAIKDGAFVLGVGEAYLKSLLDLKPEASLNGAQRFSDALKAAGGPATSGLVYVDVAGVRSALEANLPADARQQYEQQLKPYLQPLDQLISVGVQDGADQRSHLQLIVK